MLRDTISLQEFLIEVNSFLVKNKWSLRKVLWHSLIYIYSQCEPEEFLWFLREIRNRQAAKTHKIVHIKGEPMWGRKDLKNG